MKTLRRGVYLGSQADTLFYRNIIVSKTDYHQKEDQSWHYHQNSFFAYFLKGGNRELRKANEIRCSAGTLLFYKPGEVHCNKDYSLGSRIFHLEIDEAWFTENSVNPENIRHSEVNDIIAKNIFINILREFAIRDDLSEGSIQSLMLYLFNLLARPIDAQRLNPSWKNLDKIISEQPLGKQSLANIASRLDVHPVTLSREFPKCFGCTFGEFVRQLRIEKALPMLAKKSLPISDVAASCGFHEPANFIRFFKRVKGITPNAYRQLL
jgi:AraC family transcriptional regulator